MNRSALTLLLLGCASQAWAQSQPAPAAPPPAPSAVQGLTVTAVRPKTQRLIDRQVYTVTGNLQAGSGSAADILNETPSVDVDADGNVTLRGDPNVTILIDGKPSAQFTGPTAGLSLLQFPASQIDRIEVMTNPPAQYKAAGSAGVINIITKKGAAPGLAGVLRLSAGERGRANGGLDASFHYGRLKGSVGLGVRHDIRERLSKSGRLETDPDTAAPAQSFESIDEHFDRLTVTEKGDADYELSKRLTIGGSFSRLELDGHRFFDQLDTGGPPGAPIDSDTTRHSDGHEWHLDSSQEAHLEQKLRHPGETLRLSVQRSLTRERERYDYADTSPLPPGPPSFDDLFLSLDLVSTEFSADYDLPLGARDLKLGYDREDDANGFDNLGHTIDPVRGPVVDPNVTNHFRYRQGVDAVYGSYETPLGKWDLQAGLRIEAATASFRLITGDIPGGRRDFGAYPTLHLERPLGADGKLTLSLARRITRPDPEALNPFADHQDTHNLRAGNPNLAPQDTWKMEAGYQGGSGPVAWGATLFYRDDRNSVTSVEQPLGAGVVLITNENLPLSRSGGIDFNLGGKLGSKIAYDLSGEGFYAQIDARALGAPGLKSTAGLNLKASFEYRPTAADTAQLSFSRTDKRLTPQGFVAAINLVNVGFKHQFRPDLAAVLTVSDALDGQKFNRVVSTPTLQDNYLRYQIGRIAFLGIVYTFGGPAKGKASDFDYQP